MVCRLLTFPAEYISGLPFSVNFQSGKRLNWDYVLHNTGYVLKACVARERLGVRLSPTPGDSYAAVNGMSLARSKETRHQQSQQSEVHFLLLQMNITWCIDIKELSSTPSTLHNPLAIPFMKCVIPPKPVRSCGWGKVCLSDLHCPVVLVTDLILLKSWLWWRLKSLCY